MSYNLEEEKRYLNELEQKKSDSITLMKSIKDKKSEAFKIALNAFNNIWHIYERQKIAVLKAGGTHHDVSGVNRQMSFIERWRQQKRGLRV